MVPETADKKLSGWADSGCVKFLKSLIRVFYAVNSITHTHTHDEQTHSIAGAGLGTPSIS